MSTKTYVSLARLQQYDSLLKQKMKDDHASTLADAKSHADNNLVAAKTYTDEAVAQKSQVQFVVWDEND